MLYLAMTAAEIATNSVFSHPMGYMACHFSSYSTGLSNLPQGLPSDSLLILNDRTPPMGHDPSLVAQQLKSAAEENSCSRVLLDFQRPFTAEAATIVMAIVDTLSCPVGVSEPYAQALDCPIFLPPLPLTKALDEYIKPWCGREIWLEAALDAITITVTPEGSTYRPCPPPPDPLPHFDEALCCHYGLQLSETAAEFTLHRTWQDLNTLLQWDTVSCFVGLFQEFRKYL